MNELRNFARVCQRSDETGLGESSTNDVSRPVTLAHSNRSCCRMMGTHRAFSRFVFRMSRWPTARIFVPVVFTSKALVRTMFLTLMGAGGPPSDPSSKTPQADRATLLCSQDQPVVGHIASTIPVSESRCSSPALRWRTVPGAGPHTLPCFPSARCHRRSSWDCPGLTWRSST